MDILTLNMTPELQEIITEAIAAGEQYIYVSGLTTDELKHLADDPLSILERAKGRVIIAQRRLALHVLAVYQVG